ncbi:MAG: TRAP transporter small permease [Lautropia sp.]
MQPAPGRGNAFIKWAERVERVLDGVLGGLLALITVSLIWQIFGRYVLGRAPGWSEEVARMAIVWLTMLGTAACLRSGGHIAVTVLVHAVGPAARSALLWVRDACLLAAAGVLAWSGTRYALLNGAQDSPALEIPMSWAYASLGVGAALLALQLLLSRAGGETPRMEPLEW